MKGRTRAGEKEGREKREKIGWENRGLEESTWWDGKRDKESKKRGRNGRNKARHNMGIKDKKGRRGRRRHEGQNDGWQRKSCLPSTLQSLLLCAQPAGSRPNKKSAKLLVWRYI